MKAIYIEEPRKVSFREVDKPTLEPGTAILRLLYGGICGSDLGSYRGTFAYFSYPRVPGHEFSAEIVEIDKNSYGLKPGMVVTANPYFNCGHCYSCRRGFLNCCVDNQTMGAQRAGAFSEFISMPIERIYAGNGLDAKTLTLIEPFCISYHGVVRGNVKAEDKVLVIGGGGIGILALAAAKAKGAFVAVADVSPIKLEIAKKFGADAVVLNSGPQAIEQAVEQHTGGDGFDVSIEAVGLPATFQNCIDATAFGGNISLIGIGKQNLDFNFTLIQKKELNIHGSRNALKSDFEDVIGLVKSGKVDLSGFVSDIYPWLKAPEAFADFDRGEKLKILLDFN